MCELLGNEPLAKKKKGMCERAAKIDAKTNASVQTDRK